MKAYRLENGNLLVPIRAETEGARGDGLLEVEPDNPLYKIWEPWAVNEPPPGEEES
jgi:hypothetical protein